MRNLVVEHKDGRKTQARETCYVIAKQAWSGLIRDACDYCDVTVPAEATECPGCGRVIANR